MAAQDLLERLRSAQPEAGTVLLIALEADDTLMLRRAELPAGDRAAARRQLVLEMLSKAGGPWMVGLIDFADLPKHLAFVIGEKAEDGSTLLTEAAQHRGSELGQAIVANWSRAAAAELKGEANGSDRVT